jgi:hypothetical protein
MADLTKVKKKKAGKKKVAIVSEKHADKSEQWQHFYQLVEQKLKK